jgi:hypothetical protein
MSNIKFVDGLRAFPKRDTAPSFILCDVVLKIDDLNRFIDDNRELLSKDRELRLQLKMSKENKPYFEVNTFTPDASKKGNFTASVPEPKEKADDLPF